MEDARRAEIDVLKELNIDPKALKELTPAIEKLVQTRVDELLVERGEALRQLPSQSEKPKQDISWYVPAADTGRGMPAAVCSCGDAKYHMQVKKLHRWAQKHAERTGHRMANANDIPKEETDV